MILGFSAFPREKVQSRLNASRRHLAHMPNQNQEATIRQRGPESRQDDQDAEQNDGQWQERREEDQHEAQYPEQHPAPDERADEAGAEKLGRGPSELVEARGQVVDRRVGRAYLPGGTARLFSRPGDGGLEVSVHENDQLLSADRVGGDQPFGLLEEALGPRDLPGDFSRPIVPVEQLGCVVQGIQLGPARGQGLAPLLMPLVKSVELLPARTRLPQKRVNTSLLDQLPGLLGSASESGPSRRRFSAQPGSRFPSPPASGSRGRRDRARPGYRGESSVAPVISGT